MWDQRLAVLFAGLAVLLLLVILVPPWRSVRHERRFDADETTRILAGDGGEGLDSGSDLPNGP